MKLCNRPMLSLLLLCVGITAYAETTPQQAATIASDVLIKQRFQASRPDIAIQSVKPSLVEGLYEVKVVNGPVLYASADGRYFVLGDMFETAPGGFVNLAEKAREADREQIMAGVKLNDMIIFAPTDQPTKAVVSVFTDVDCGYCMKLHREVPDLNRLGIEVRYLAFPRAGIGSESYNKIASAWCAANPQDALTKLKNRQRIPINVCADNPVQAQYELGQKVGVTGTPALIMESGRLLPGYMPALRLAAALGVEVDPAIEKELAAKQQ